MTRLPVTGEDLDEEFFTQGCSWCVRGWQEASALSIATVVRVALEVAMRLVPGAAPPRRRCADSGKLGVWAVGEIRCVRGSSF